MNYPWRSRIALAAGITAIVFVLLSVAGDGVGPVRLGVVAMLCASVGWLAVDLAARVEVRVRTPDEAPAAGSRRGADARTSQLSRRLEEIGRPGFSDARLYDMLVELIDDRLARRHDVDRSAQPDRARAVLGTQLAAFVERQPPSRQFARRTYLDAIVTEIEEL